MSTNDPTHYIDDADDVLRQTYEEPMTLPEYTELLFSEPSVASHSARYVLSAIEHAGTRTVIEEGEEKERYCFFDDPWNDGEHAILGNTEVLNWFVDDLRAIASGRGKGEKILWIEGPTACGKSELKRCLVSGLREYSKTDEGRRYTLEWSIRGSHDGVSGMTYGDTIVSASEGDWYESPVQVHPLSVYPESVRSTIVDELNDELDDDLPVQVETDLDPFSREAYETLCEMYRDNGTGELFREVTSPEHLRVSNYIVDVGRGIGVLHSEDCGSTKEQLVGSWMPSMYDETNSRGRKNPQAFSYDGVLSQGNGGMTIIEDAGGHAALLTRLLNVPDESHVKLDKGIGMDIDTVLLVISNPDLTELLESGSEAMGEDQYRALKRRLERHRIRYLTNISLEAELLHRELTNEYDIWMANEYDELESRMQAGRIVSVSGGSGDVDEYELAPHTIEAAALYAVVSRLKTDGLPSSVSLVDKAILFDSGEVEMSGETYTLEDVEESADVVHHPSDGRGGIPVTHVRDTISEMWYIESDRSHPELDVENVIMPTDVLEAVTSNFNVAPMFTSDETRQYESRKDGVADYILAQQSHDVLDGILSGEKIDEETILEYLEHVYAMVTDETVETDRGAVEPDPLKMKVFEVEYLGKFGDDDYGSDNESVSDRVAEFRKDEIVAPLTRNAWEQRTDGFEIENVDFWDVPGIRDVLHDYDWSDVRNRFDDFDPHQWDDPPEGTETEQLKEKTIAHMVDHGYTEASAEITSRKVLTEVADQWV